LRWLPLETFAFTFLRTRALVIQCIVDNIVVNDALDENFIFFFNINGEDSSSLLIDYDTQTDPNACCEAKISRMETKNQRSPSQHHVINHESVFPNICPIDVFCHWATCDQ
jgi:hypothetical protein